MEYPIYMSTKWSVGVLGLESTVPPLHHSNPMRRSSAPFDNAQGDRHMILFSSLLDWLTAVLDAPYILTSKEGE
jgi:hypothetical protein